MFFIETIVIIDNKSMLHWPFQPYKKAQNVDHSKEQKSFSFSQKKNPQQQTNKPKRDATDIQLMH